jgi:hypothetical protein
MTQQPDVNSLQRLLDLQDIQQVLALYTVALDSREFDLFDDCVTPDTQIFLPGYEPLNPASYVEMLKRELPRLDATHHLVGLPVIRVDGNRAYSRCYFIAQSVRDALTPNSCLSIGGWYADEWIRTERGWRISRREGTALWCDGNPRVLDYEFMGTVPRGDGQKAPEWLRHG